jgi:hypothetical protein
MRRRKSPRKLDWALQYARLGLPVFPLQPGGKTPLTPHGFKDATTSREQIIGRWTDHPDANIGIPTGEASGLLVLDIDPRHGGYESLAKLCAHRNKPKTAISITGGGGLHIILQHIRGVRCETLAPVSM